MNVDMRRVNNNIKNHSNWLAYYGYKYFGTKKHDFTFKCRSGLEVNVPQRMLQTYKECFFDETYFKGLPKNLINDSIKTVVDVGANVGYFSLFILNQYPKAKVYAYEPMPVNYALLNRYKSENTNFDFTVINEAVSKAEVQSITLNYQSSDSFTTAASVFESDSQTDQLEVKTTNLKSIIDGNKLDKIDFLKLDCEGSEYAILYDATKEVLDKVSMMSIETHPGKTADESADALIQYLNKNGFETNMKGDIIWAWHANLS